VLTIVAYAVARSLPSPSQHLGIITTSLRLRSGVSRTPDLRHRAVVAFAVRKFSVYMRTA